MLVNKKGLKFEIIEYLKNKKCKIRFIESGFTNTVSISNVRKVPAEVKDLFHRDVIGIGYIDTKPSLTNEYYSYYYSVWRNMLNRCYGKNRKYYEDVTVCEEWHSFRMFHDWCLDMGLTPMHNVDKDLIGKKLYSKDTCIVTHKLLNIGLSYNSRKINPPSLVSKINSDLFRVRVVYLVDKLIDLRVHCELDAYILSTFLKEFYLRKLAKYLNRFCLMSNTDYDRFIKNINISNQYYFKKLDLSDKSEYSFKLKYFKDNLHYKINLDTLEEEIKNYILKHCD